MDLRQYLEVLWRRWTLVLAVLVTTIGAALAVSLLIPQRWSATATLRIDPGDALVAGSVQSDDITYLERLVNTYRRMADRSHLDTAVGRRLRLDEPPMVTVADLPNTNLVTVEATTGSKSTAALAANAVARALVREIRASERGFGQATTQRTERRIDQLEGEIATARTEVERLDLLPVTPVDRRRALELREEIRSKRFTLESELRTGQTLRAMRDARIDSVTVASPATSPTGPANRRLPLALAVGLLLGLVAGPGIAFLAENLSRRLRSGDEIESSVHAPVLAAVPHVHRREAGALVERGSAADEAFRRLRTMLLLPPYENLRTVAVTGVEQGSGATTLVANLGRSLAEAGRAVLVVDGDLRNPGLHEAFGVSGEDGLGDLLLENAERQRAAAVDRYRWTDVPGLAVLAAGHATGDPTTLLGSPPTGRLLAELRLLFEFVLIDTPPVLLAPDALAVAHHADGVVLVTGSEVERDVLRLATRELTRAGATPVGVVVNGVERRAFHRSSSSNGVASDHQPVGTR